MRFASTAVVLIGVLVTAWTSVGARQSTDRSAASPGAGGRDAAASDTAGVVKAYCAGCHNGVMRSPSGQLLDRFDALSIATDPHVWSRAYRQLLAGTMPPVGAPRPARAVSDALLASIEAALRGRTAPLADDTSEEIARRLARLLWNSEPDALLLQDARSGRLSDAAIVERHVRRMVEDDRARTLVARFFFPWLGLDRLGQADPDKKAFPAFTVALRDAMAMETELFLLSQLREDRDPIELWSANYTFLNEALARHYGVSGVAGASFRRVAVPGPERTGLLGHGSILMVTSRHQHGPDAAYTSPAARAMWVRLHFLGAPAPRPFPGAQPVRPELPITPQTRTLPAMPCVNCHRNFFPLGYALENFDPIGRWRTHDQAGPVDASGTFVDGTPTDGVVALREVLLTRPDAFRTTIVEKLIIHASGRPASWPTTPESLIRARQVLRSVKSPRWSSLIASIARATPLAEP
jgi:hypothetical protein